MIREILSVVLLVSAIEAGGYHHIYRSSLPIQLEPANILTSSGIQLGQPLRYYSEQSIPRSLLSHVSTSTNSLPQTVPEYLLSIPRNVEFGPLPQSIPAHLLTITAPQASSQPLFVASAQSMPSMTFSHSMVSSPSLGSVGSSQSFGSLSPFTSPAQVARSKSSALTPTQPDLSSQSLPLSTNSQGSQNSASGAESTGFSTPFKPLNFAPNLKEVDKQLTQTQQQTIESDQTVRSPELSQQVEQKVDNVGQESIGQTLPKIESPAAPAAPAANPSTGGLFGSSLFKANSN